MKENVASHIALHAPNLVNVCVDKFADEKISGRLYHCYTEEPWKFETIVHLVELMETLYDGISYPQASTETRCFVNSGHKDSATLKKVKEQSEIITHRGKEGTFYVHVQYRQHSSWQGDIEWVDRGIKKQFRSELEMIKLMSDAIEGI